jgi:hypothetical protein
MLGARQPGRFPAPLPRVRLNARYADLRTPRPNAGKMTRSFLIAQSAIRNRRNFIKTKDGDDF